MNASARDGEALPTPPSVGKLEKYVLAHANREGLAVGRVRHWISFMMLSGALDRAAERPGGPRFVVKGGVALELRLPTRARATEDLDIVAVCDEDDLLTALDEALREPYHHCTFSRRAETYPLGDKAVRVSVQIAYRSQRWATIQVDLTRPEATDTETERLPGIPLRHFGLVGPVDVPCISMRYHIAQKFHGMTKVPHHGGDSDRFRDAVDLLLMRDLLTEADLRAVREACEETFRIRAEHAWPPTIVLPSTWRDPYASMAQAVGIGAHSLDAAEGALRAFVAAIIAA
jgi:hypothetical protein